MRKLLSTFLSILLIAGTCYAQNFPPLNVEEEDGTPSTFPYKLKVTNGTLTDNADGTVSVTTGGGGSGDFLADGTVDMTGNFNINTQAIEDANSNELVTFVTGASAVNNIQITNAAAGDAVKLTAVGGDTNIDLHLEPKGIGIIRLEETLPSTAGQSLAEMMFDIDSSAQVSSSEFHAILVETTGTPAGEVAALGTVGKVDVIHQHVATPATPNQDEFAGKKTGGGADWVDGDTPVTGEDLDGNDMFATNADEIYFGSATQFDEVEVIMGTAATKNVVPTFWYNTAADAWTQFFPDDGTDGFQQSGDIIWLLSGITGLWTGNGDPGVDDTTAGYWIKVIRTRVSSPGTPTPTTIKIGLVTTYFWDKTGAIDALSVEGNTLTEGGVGVPNLTEGATITGEWDLNAATFEPPNSAADVVLADAGNMHLNTTDEQLSFHSAADGEISGEAAISLLRHVSASFDPSSYYDQESTYRVLPLFYIGVDAPEGVVVTEWKCAYVGGDPTTELDADLCFDTTPDHNPAAGMTIVDVIDTTNGTSSESTTFDDATVDTASNVYIRFGADPADANVVVAFDVWFYNEED